MNALSTDINLTSKWRGKPACPVGGQKASRFEKTGRLKRVKNEM